MQTGGSYFVACELRYNNPFVEMFKALVKYWCPTWFGWIQTKHMDQWESGPCATQHMVWIPFGNTSFLLSILKPKEIISTLTNVKTTEKWIGGAFCTSEELGATLHFNSNGVSGSQRFDGFSGPNSSLEAHSSVNSFCQGWTNNALSLQWLQWSCPSRGLQFFFEKVWTNFTHILG